MLTLFAFTMVVTIALISLIVNVISSWKNNYLAKYTGSKLLQGDFLCYLLHLFSFKNNLPIDVC